MKKSISNRLLFICVTTILSINCIFIIFLSIFQNENLKTEIENEMVVFKDNSLIVVSNNNILEEPLWKTLYNIYKLTNSYVTITDQENKIIQSIGEILNEDKVNEIISNSQGRKSIIDYKIENGNYIVTYNYPIYNEQTYNGNLILQKDYTLKYQAYKRLITFIILGQTVVGLTIIIILIFSIKKITNPITELDNSMKDYRNGKENKELISNRDDEIGSLINSYNLMKGKIKENEIKQINFFNNATHELKTPITSISAYSQILKDSSINDLDEDFFNRSTNRLVLECNKMTKLVENILDISKGEFIEKKEEKFSLKDSVENILEEYIDKDINFEMVLDIKEVELLGNKSSFENIVKNLIDNSIKYSKDKKGRINLYENNDKIIFNISNKAEKIPKEIEERLLEPFIKFKNFPNLEEEISSSGLGLYLAKGRAEENHWVLNYKIDGDYIIFNLIIEK